LTQEKGTSDATLFYALYTVLCTVPSRLPIEALLTAATLQLLTFAVAHVGGSFLTKAQLEHEHPALKPAPADQEAPSPLDLLPNAAVTPVGGQHTVGT